jgi:hypothetical protein
MSASWIDYAGYRGCVALENTDTRVVLGPHVGGRVLEYAWRGENALWLDAAHNGITVTPGQRTPLLFPSGGRFDIGPELTLPPRPELWVGPWEAELTGPLAARMTSSPSPSVGVQLTREFTLAPEGSHLACTQIMRNVADRPTRCNHWARTFGRGHGIAIVPLTPELSRFPHQYVMYVPNGGIDVRPEDPAIRIRDGFLEVFDTPAYPKLGIDAYAGWFAYLMPNDLLFIKRFPTYPDRVYFEAAGLTISLWYFQDVVCELEPIGPGETLAPGASASFTEEWWLVPFPFPEQRDALDLDSVVAAAEAAMGGR